MFSVMFFSFLSQIRVSGPRRLVKPYKPVKPAGFNELPYFFNGFRAGMYGSGQFVQFKLFALFPVLLINRNTMPGTHDVLGDFFMSWKHDAVFYGNTSKLKHGVHGFYSFWASFLTPEAGSAVPEVLTVEHAVPQPHCRHAQKFFYVILRYNIGNRAACGAALQLKHIRIFSAPASSVISSKKAGSDSEVFIGCFIDSSLIHLLVFEVIRQFRIFR